MKRRTENDAAGSILALVVIFLALLVFCAWNDSRPVIEFTPEQIRSSQR